MQKGKITNIPNISTVKILHWVYWGNTDRKAAKHTGFFFFFLFVVNFVIHWNETAMGLHIRGCLPWDSACSAGATGDTGLIPGSRRSPGEGNGNPLQYFCLQNPKDRGARWALVHEVTKSWTQLK